MITLSNRMNANINLLASTNSVADIGCDHAYASIALIERDIASKVYAMDIVPGPLEKARFNIKRAGLEDKIEIRLSDGAKSLKPFEADSAIIAGMGGMLMERILSASDNVFKAMNQLVLQPQSDLNHFRRFLYQNGYSIDKEDMVFEEGKYYPTIHVLTQQTNYILSDEEYMYGPYLLQHKHPVLKDYLCYERTQKEKLLNNLSAQSQSTNAHIRAVELKKELSLNEKALKYFY